MTNILLSFIKAVQKVLKIFLAGPRAYIYATKQVKVEMMAELILTRQSCIPAFTNEMMNVPDSTSKMTIVTFWGPVLWSERPLVRRSRTKNKNKKQFQPKKTTTSAAKQQRK